MSQGSKYLNTVKNVWKSEGPIGFYRGFIPPFIGSIIYRSAQFSVFEAVYTKFQSYPSLCGKIPFTGGLEPRVLMAGFAAGSARVIIETPIEYAKVKRQTGQTW